MAETASIGTKKGRQPPSEVASHLPVSTILRYRLIMCLLHDSIRGAWVPNGILDTH